MYDLKGIRFHHIGVATNDISQAIKVYSLLGYKLQLDTVHRDPIQNVKIALMSKDNSPLIELIEPWGERSPIDKVLGKNGATPYHTCYEVEDIDQAISDLKENGFLPIIKPVKAVAFNNRLICFLFNRHIGLIELLQEQ